MIVLSYKKRGHIKRRKTGRDMVNGERKGWGGSGDRIKDSIVHSMNSHLIIDVV